METSYDLTNLEEFNKLLNFKLTFSWIMLFIILISVIFFIIGSSFFSIPVYVEGNGVLMNKSKIQIILSDYDGIINNINVKDNERVTSGTALATIKPDKVLPGKEFNTVTANDDFTIIEQWIYPSLYVTEGTPLFTVEKTNFSRNPFIIAFFTMNEAEMIEPGMETLIDISLFNKNFSLKGKISKVSQYPISPELMFYEIGNEDIVDYMKDQYQSHENPLTDVIITITENQDGTYEWIGNKPDFYVKTGTFCTCSIKTDKQTFMEKLLPWVSK